MRPKPHVLTLPYRTDSVAWFACLAGRRQPVWLDSGRPHSTYGRFDIMAAEPETILSSQDGKTRLLDAQGQSHSLTGHPFDLIEQWLPQPLEPVPDLPFVSGAIGYFSYDLVRQLESLPAHARHDIALPDFWLGLYPWAIVQDHHRKQTFLVARPDMDPMPLHRELSQQDPDFELKQFLEPKKSFKIRKFKEELTADSYQKKLSQIQAYIRAGDCYQVNLAQRFQADCQGDPLAAYLALRQALPSPFSGYLPRPEGAILSLSPERFIALRNGVAETRPIKGTAPRHPDPIRDQAEADALRRSAKNRAENLMIVDLLRNDLSKCCDEVRVPALFELQSFANVHHLVSTVTGHLKSGATAVDLLRGSFPGGSITGAPKIRAMEIIEELEPVRRSVYCGSLGYLSADGQMDTSIAIRTLVCHQNRLYCWGGGGIVADSEPDAEYQESLNKVRVLMETLEREFGDRPPL
ncbi:aminodeoxychorismate synthase component I [Marinimicrobium sp. ARAG 43.8]|uniref:aminodeoxychorismate synthase component I n=1 Tax=Marinimicrobium sp. ARAG 43.8 TaxID=3418719 RepID=UPI003CECC09F